MVDSRYQFVLIVNILDALYRLDEPLQNLMVEKSSARTSNIVQTMVSALLSLPIVENLAALGTLVEER